MSFWAQYGNNLVFKALEVPILGGLSVVAPAPGFEPGTK